MHVLAIEPYWGGSHRVFLEQLARHSRHRWSVVSRPARHWKWRMRSAPPDLIDDVAGQVRANGQPNVLFCSDMLDLPTWLGFASCDRRLAGWVRDSVKVTYFHENQWAYPVGPEAQVDHHYGFTNLLTAAVSDACVFNSRFNRDSFFEGSTRFVASMPDTRRPVDLEGIAARSHIIAPGFTPPRQPRRAAQADGPITLGWVGRFEHDKRPDRFSELLDRLRSAALDFQLVLLGQRGRRTAALEQIRERHHDRIRFDGFATSRQDYECRLAEIDLVISTADHEFFGIALCEAIWSGAVPVTPNGLSYREYVPEALRYDSMQQAAELIIELARLGQLDRWRESSRRAIAEFRSEVVATRLDDLLSELVSKSRAQ